jgi:hypothetical protein
MPKKPLILDKKSLWIFSIVKKTREYILCISYFTGLISAWKMIKILFSELADVLKRKPGWNAP